MGSPQSGPSQGAGAKPGSGVDIQMLIKIIDDATASARTKIENMQGQQEALSIGEMFTLQLDMNRLSQLSEMTTSVVSAMGQATQTIARHVKGG